jgi:hypothetical protein
MAFGRRKQEKAQALVETGSRAVGVVVSVQDTGMTMNDNPRVRMSFRIEPLDGTPPFDAEKTKVVSRVQIPRPGERYPVWYDAADPETWAYATIENEQGIQQIRQLFGPAADTMTGIASTAVAAAPAAAAAAPDAFERLKKLDELRTAGLVTEAEFAEKKAQLLAEL